MEPDGSRKEKKAEVLWKGLASGSQSVAWSHCPLTWHLTGSQRSGSFKGVCAEGPAGIVNSAGVHSEWAAGTNMTVWGDRGCQSWPGQSQLLAGRGLAWLLWWGRSLSSDGGSSWVSADAHLASVPSAGHGFESTPTPRAVGSMRLFISLRGRETDRREPPHAGSLPRCPQQLGLGQTKARSPEPNLPCSVGYRHPQRRLSRCAEPAPGS